MSNFQNRMGTPTTTMSSDSRPQEHESIQLAQTCMKHINPPSPTLAQNDRQQIRIALNDVLENFWYLLEDFSDDCNNDTVDWTTIHDLLLLLGQLPLSNLQQLYESSEDDPLGRIFLTKLLAKNPPLHCLDAAILAFPYALSDNHPVAFFVASRDATPTTVGRMMQSIVQSQQNENGITQHCPYPWILSPYITVEAATAMVEMYPAGIWQKPSPASAEFLTSKSSVYSPLDYLLFSADVIERHEMDPKLWQKFKLILAASNCSSSDSNKRDCHDLAPVHTILDRIFTFPGKFDAN